jgi:hypothetical protein
VHPPSLSELLLARYALRVPKETEEYLLKRLRTAGSGTSNQMIPVIGGHARTGVPQRRLLPVAELLQLFPPGAGATTATS